MSGDVYSVVVHSFTHGTDNHVVVSREFLNANDKILIVDDFLANGSALRGRIELAEQAGAEVVGCAAAIEKGFQEGGDLLRMEGHRVESLAIIDQMTDCEIVFRP